MVKQITLRYGLTKARSNLAAFQVLRMISASFFAGKYHDLIDARRFDAQAGKGGEILGLDQGLKPRGEGAHPQRLFLDLLGQLFPAPFDQAEEIHNSSLPPL